MERQKKPKLVDDILAARVTLLVWDRHFRGPLGARSLGHSVASWIRRTALRLTCAPTPLDRGVVAFRRLAIGRRIGPRSTGVQLEQIR